MGAYYNQCKEKWLLHDNHVRICMLSLHIKTDITIHKLSKKILALNGVIEYYKDSNNEYPLFETKEDVEKFIEYLEPYIVLKELCK